MAKHGRGLICLALTRQRVEQLGLPLMAQGNESRLSTAFTVSIEAREGITTGISAADRARTVQVAIDPGSTRADLATPGHIFPVMARDGGVLVRAGHTEAAVDIARLAGLNPAGVICEIMNDDGTMARLPDLVAFAQRHGLKVAKIADLISYRLSYDKLVERDIASTPAHALRRRFPPAGVHQRADRRGAHRAGQGRSGGARPGARARARAQRPRGRPRREQRRPGRHAAGGDGRDPRRRTRRRRADPRTVADQHLRSDQGAARPSLAAGSAAARLRHRRADPEGPRHRGHDPSCPRASARSSASRATACAWWSIACCTARRRAHGSGRDARRGIRAAAARPAADRTS